ncbi:anti-sigma-factor antagonist [Catenulispora acidiphila DSM 44928]|uniref:Anti-sigma factor antagonist n=1 Tax=Catenulispora acidiphila (strain DSM 44928 / JCM 14897 / NBRC 102108 / NRRL B-24433 / ID139908) TaxID=479433 RepID=C7Q137_CATAD|nr:STAS domain-containing protein [Catenulispora acidiphila]ACU71712.1 anti-sigma-factor antagonist [Catenulispora acidiphila DSM 44928]
MREFSYRVREQDSVSVVEVSGDVDMSVAGQLSGVLEPLVAAGDVVVDCTAVTFFDSMGLRVAVDAMNRAGQAGTAFSLVPSQMVARVLELAGVSGLFVIHDSVPTSA